MSKLQLKFESKIGTLYLIGSEIGLQGVFWERQNVPMDHENNDIEVILNISAIQIEEYLEGKRKVFNMKLDIEGTDFQKTVWEKLSKIPYGETRSYKEVAIALKQPKASRAVGNANGKNPLCIIVPCHRVISADGSLGGYSRGLNIKKILLALEKTGKM